MCAPFCLLLLLLAPSVRVFMMYNLCVFLVNYSYTIPSLSPFRIRCFLVFGYTLTSHLFDRNHWTLGFRVHKIHV